MQFVAEIQLKRDNVHHLVAEVTPRFLDGLGAYFRLPAAPFDRR
jgi:hypothetical protein